MNALNTFMLALTLSRKLKQNILKWQSKWDTAALCKLLFHVCSVSTTVSFNWYRLKLLFLSAKCSGQPTAGAEQMFTSEQLRLETVYSKLLKEFSETIWSIFSDFCQIFHSKVSGLIIVVLLKFNTKIKLLKSRFLSLPLKALHNLGPNHSKPHSPLF